MNLHPITFAGISIDNGTTLIAKAAGDSFYNQSPVNLVYSPVADNYPTYSTRVLQPRELTINIQMSAATAHTLVDTLNKIFDVTKGEQTLVAEDTDNSDKQWYMLATVARPPRIVGALYTVTLRAAIGLWRSVTVNSDATWNPISSGATHNLSWTPSGNAGAQPTITLTPQAAKAGGYTYFQYVLMTNPLDVTLDDWWELTDGGLDTAAIVADASKSNQVNNGAGTGTGTTPFPIDTAVGGGLPAAGYCYVDSEQIQYTISGSTFTPVARGVNGTSAANHLDNAVLKWSRVQADGDDFRVFVNFAEVDRSFGASPNVFNAAATYIYARTRLQPRIEIPLATAIAGAGAITEIALNTGKAYRDAFNRLPKAGQLMIGSEALTWTGKDEKNFKLNGTVTRACFDTSEGAHAVGDTCKWLEHVILFVYGNFSASTPTIDGTRIPIWALTSTNLSHVYTSMSDDAGLRAGRWTGSLGNPRSKGRGDTRLYTGHQTADANPATELGIYAESWRSGNRYQDESIDASWSIYVPQGVTTVTATGEKRRTSSSWPVFTFEKSVDGKKWTVVWTEATPSGAVAWENWAAHSAVSLSGTYYYLRFRMRGNIQAGAGYYAASELNDITLTLASKPTITLKAENTAAYDLDVKISNVTNGEYFTVRRMIAITQSLQIVLGPKTRSAVYLKDQTTGPRIEFPDTQTAPMHLVTGVTNQLKIEETGLADVDVTVTAEDWSL